MSTIVADGAHFGCDVNDDATVLLGFFCGLLPKATTAFLQEGSKVFCHN